MAMRQPAAWSTFFAVLVLAIPTAAAQPALRYVLDREDFAGAEKLLADGHSIDEIDAPNSNRTALFFASTRAAAWLIEHHADVRHLDGMKAKALNFNVSLGAPKRDMDDFKSYVSLLVAHGVDVNARDM